MKVLHITNNFPTNKYPIFGIFVKEQIDSLTTQNIVNEIHFINGREKGKIEYLKQIFIIRNLLKEKKFDIIHCHHAFSAITLYLSGYKKPNVVISFQSDPKNECGPHLYKWLKSKSNINIFKNNNVHFDNIKNFYLPNGVNLDFFRPLDKVLAYKRMNLDQDKRYILFMSSNYLRKEKRFDRFKRIINLLKTRYKLNDIEELVLINEKRENIPFLINSSSLHLLTSDFEGSPNSVKEAMACNIPIVSTDVGNVRELLDRVECSYVANTLDDDEIAELCYRALGSRKLPDSRQVLINKGLDSESIANKLIQIYRKISGDNK